MMGVIGKQITSALVWRIAGVCVLLLGLLSASVAVNVRQWADHRAYVSGEKDRLNAAAAKAGLQVAAKIAAQKPKDDRSLFDAMGRIEDRVAKLQDAKRPPPLAAQCAPGKQRMDAVNAGADR